MGSGRKEREEAGRPEGVSTPLTDSSALQGRVVVISFGTPDAFRRVQRTLPFCTKKGKWLVLDNCQLLKSWDPEVLLQLELVLTTPAGQRQEGLGKFVSGESRRTCPYSYLFRCRTEQSGALGDPPQVPALAHHDARCP